MRKILFPALLLVAVSGFAQGKPVAPAPAESKVVATINGENVTADDLDRMYRNLSPNMRASYEKAGGKKQFLQQYVGKRLIVQEAVKGSFDKRTDVAAALRDARETALFDLYVRYNIAASTVSEAEMRRYYEAHQGEFQTPETIKARHIIATPGDDRVMNTTGDNAKTDADAQKKINDLRKAAETNKEMFSSLALRFSEDAAAPSGGDLGWFTRGQMVKEFEAAAFATPVGQVSPVVKSTFGYHIILVEDRREGGVKPFEEVASEIRERLLTERADRVMADLNSLTLQLRQASQIQLHEENIN